MLTDRVFIAGLIILAINDHYLKSNYPNMITGKLSDFVGLFIFPIFLSVILPVRTKTNYFLAALIFIVWNSPLVEQLIQVGKSIGLPLHRTVDPTDLLASRLFYHFHIYICRDYKRKKSEKNILEFLW